MIIVPGKIFFPTDPRGRVRIGESGIRLDSSPGWIAMLCQLVVERLKSVRQRTYWICRPSRPSIRIEGNAYRSIVVFILRRRRGDMGVNPGASYPGIEE